ncbi:FxSxx-COOH system tetratricopeptide repeat protein [Streptomyces cinerochromogenes]|uniref:FxSxx-COOH system tetratricopeptide repeat protein n=1 Tax=Streptomyces cinerochromogenes TaxID=66422 RepID=UPI0036B06656
MVEGRRRTRPWGPLKGPDQQADALAQLLRDWLDGANLRVDDLRKRLTPEHFTTGRVPSRTTVADRLAGVGLDNDFVEAVADVCSADAAGRQRLLEQARAVRSGQVPRQQPRRQPAPAGDGGIAGELIVVQRHSLAVSDKLLRAMERVAELERERNNANQMVLLLLAMVDKLQRDIETLTSEQDRLRGDVTQPLVQEVHERLERSEEQRRKAEHELDRARDERRRADRLAEEAADQVRALTAELELLRRHAAAAQGGPLPVVVAPEPGGHERLDADAGDIDQALAKAALYLDGGADRLDRLADELRLDSATDTTTGSPADISADIPSYNPADNAADNSPASGDAADNPPDIPAAVPGTPAEAPDALPPVYNVPRRNTRFTGRESLLDETHRLLAGNGPRAGAVTLYGMLGVGKTQLATEYVYRFGSEYDAVWWINADSRAGTRHRLAELVRQLDLSTGPAYGERLRAVRDALHRGTPYSRWLLVLDGADEPDSIGDLVPTGPGHVLITSRSPGWGDHRSELLEVRVLDEEASVALVRRRAPRLTVTDAHRLAEALAGLPLLLDQVAGWLHTSGVSVDDYLSQGHRGFDRDVALVSADYQLPFQDAWTIQLNKLRETAPESVDLLHLFAFFAPGRIPVRLLREMPIGSLSKRLAALLGDPQLWATAVNRLHQASVVRLVSPEAAAEGGPSSGDSVYLHPMVHGLVRGNMPETDRLEFGSAVRRALTAADPRKPADTRHWDTYAEIVPHMEYADVLSNVSDIRVQELRLNCLQYLYLAGVYESGASLAQRALDTVRELLGASHSWVWDLVHAATSLLRACGRYERVHAMDRAAREQLRAERGLPDPYHLRATEDLSADLRALGRWQEALELCQWVYGSHRAQLGPLESRTLHVLSGLGSCLRLLGRYKEALESDRESLEGRRQQLRRGHPLTLSAHLAYATDLRLLGRYQDAESAQAASVREHREVLGADHPQTLRAEHNLALCRRHSGDHVGAGQVMDRVARAARDRLGAEHPDTLAFTAGLSCLAREEGDLDEAWAASESVMSGYERLLPAEHPFLAGLRANHALVLERTEQRDGAHALIEQALSDLTAALGESHPYTLGCALNASGLRNGIGDTEGAAALSKKTVARAAEALGRVHPLTLSARVAHAADLRDLRRRQDADGFEQMALRDLEDTLGILHPRTAAARARHRPYWDFEPEVL